MRRPLKPFVTEYKTPSRRPPISPGEQASPQSDGQSAKLFDMRMKPDAEDSYEAAMRAADALFSGKPNTTPQDALDRPPGPPARDWDDVDSEAPAAPSRNGGGRILRVLDEAPAPEYAALEAAHAPKRRGRKPGSKNKPKGPAIAAEPLGPGASAAATLAFEPPAPKLAPAPPEPAHSGPAAVAQVPVPVAQVPALVGRVSRPKVDKRFAWVPDKLKPGEDWKRRRLPRVCW